MQSHSNTVQHTLHSRGGNRPKTESEGVMQGVFLPTWPGPRNRSSSQGNTEACFDASRMHNSIVTHTGMAGERVLAPLIGLAAEVPNRCFPFHTWKKGKVARSEPSMSCGWKKQRRWQFRDPGVFPNMETQGSFQAVRGCTSDGLGLIVDMLF